MCASARSPRALLALVCLIAWLCLGAALVVPAQAHAAGWPFASARAVVCAYGSPWASDAARTHRGVDLAAAEGDSVVAPEDATVTFAGLVPTDSGRVRAVTLELADGRRMTLMPLVSAAVSTGERLSVGETVGRVSAEGDGSIASTHLHVSLRRGETYLDPMTALVVPAAAGSDTAPAEEPVTVPSVSPAPAGGGVGVVASAAHAAPSGSTASAGSGITLADGSAASASQAVQTSAQAAESGAREHLGAAGTSATGLETNPNTRGITLATPETSSIRGFGTDALISRAYSWARSSLPSLLTRSVLALLMLLSGVALLWPLWRRSTEGEPVVVTPGGDDVAAAVSR